MLFQCQALEEAIAKVIPNYDISGETEIRIDEWRIIGYLANQKEDISKEIYREADEWLQSVFQEYDRFTILGI